MVDGEDSQRRKQYGVGVDGEGGEVKSDVNRMQRTIDGRESRRESRRQYMAGIYFEKPTEKTKQIKSDVAGNQILTQHVMSCLRSRDGRKSC